MKKLEVLGLQTVPEIKAGDDLPKIIVDCAEREAQGLREKILLFLRARLFPRQ